MDAIKADESEIVWSTKCLKYLDHNSEYPFPKIKWHHTSSNEINKIIKSLKPKNSAVYNDIPLKILKISALFMVSPLTYICSHALSLGIFPERLKYSVVKLMFMKGDRSVIYNYRPIFLITSFSKIFVSLYMPDHMTI